MAAEGVVGIWLSFEWNVPPGAAIAVLSGSVFAAVAALTTLRRHRALLLPGLAVLAFVAAGCGSGGGAGGSQVEVVATTTQIGDWARQVGGTGVKVHQLLQPNTDPHDYEPRPADVVSTAGADVVFENGDELDHWMGKVVSEAGGNPAVVVLGDHVPVKRPGENSGPEASRYDAHWWHDPRNAISAVEQIRNALVDADAAHANAYRRHAAAYVSRLRSLDRGIESCMSKVPVTARKLVTDHDAFGYFADRYGIKVVGAVIPSQTTQAQPSARDTARLIALVEREHVKAVFPESSINPGSRRRLRARPAPTPTTRSTATRSARRDPRRDVSLDGGRERGRDGQRVHRRQGSLHVSGRRMIADDAPGAGNRLLTVDDVATGYGVRAGLSRCELRPSPR